jgi:hypothetical protein
VPGPGVEEPAINAKFRAQKPRHEISDLSA